MDRGRRSFPPGNFAEVGRALPAVRLLQPLERPDSGACGSTFALKHNHAQRGQVEFRRVWPAVPRTILCRDTAKISLVAAPVDFRVAVQDFLPLAAARQA